MSTVYHRYDSCEARCFILKAKHEFELETRLIATFRWIEAGYIAAEERQ